MDDYEELMPRDPKAHLEISRKNVWNGIYCAILFMCAFAYLKPYLEYGMNDVNQRLNRVVLMLTLIYMGFLIFIFNLRPDHGRELIGFLDVNLNKPVTKEMHTYDDNCELEWSNFLDNFDHYYIVHLCNWFLASLVIRDSYMLHFWQILDEVVELSVQHILPHFRECWWDHIICDILLSNIPAITAGMFFLRWVGIKEYDWLGRKGKESIWDWEMFNCHKKFGIIIYQQTLLLIHFLNGFFLNNALLIPPKHFFPIARLLLWFAIGAIGHREAYLDGETWGTKKRKDQPIEGRFRWLSTAILFTEIILCWKYRAGTGNLIDAATPIYVWLPWTAVFVGCIIFWFYLRFRKGHTVKYPGYEGQFTSARNMSPCKAYIRRSSPAKASRAAVKASRSRSPVKKDRKIK